MAVYLDVLMIVNFYVTFFLIKAECLFLHLNIKQWRCVTAAGIGGISSLFILAGDMNVFLTLFMKISLAALIVFTFGGFVSVGNFLKNTAVFLLVNVVFAGIMLMLELFVCPMNMIYNNGIVYFDISLLFLIISTAVSYVVIRAVRYVLDVRGDSEYEITVSISGKAASFAALADSGNSLADCFTGLPVIVADIKAVSAILPERTMDFLTTQADISDAPPGLKFIPYTTINGSSIIRALKPEKTIIRSRGKEKSVDALLGISKHGFADNDYSAVFNPKLLI